MVLPKPWGRIPSLQASKYKHEGVERHQNLVLPVPFKAKFAMLLALK